MQNLHLCFETVANQLRMQILHSLKNKPMNVNELTKELGVERTRISHSLQILLRCNLVLVKQKGKERIYKLNAQSPFFSALIKCKGIFPIIEAHKEIVCQNCNKVLE